MSATFTASQFQRLELGKKGCQLRNILIYWTEPPLLTSLPNRCWSPNTIPQADPSAKGCQGTEEGMREMGGDLVHRETPTYQHQRAFLSWLFGQDFTQQIKPLSLWWTVNNWPCAHDPRDSWLNKVIGIKCHVCCLGFGIFEELYSRMWTFWVLLQNNI